LNLYLSGAAGRIRTCELLRERISHLGAQVKEVYVYESGLPVYKKLKDNFFQDLTSRDNQNQRILHAKYGH
jgi:uroporphyrinogen-III synthase